MTSQTQRIVLDKATYEDEGYRNRCDPLTLEPFKIGDEVRLCSQCGTAFLEDSWNTTGSICLCFKGGEKIDLRRRATPAQPSETETSKSWMWLVYLIIFILFLAYQFS